MHFALPGENKPEIGARLERQQYGKSTAVRGHRVETEQEEAAVRLVSDGIQIEPLLVAPVVALPMLLADTRQLFADAWTDLFGAVPDDDWGVPGDA